MAVQSPYLELDARSARHCVALECDASDGGIGRTLTACP